MAVCIVQDTLPLHQHKILWVSHGLCVYVHIMKILNSLDMHIVDHLPLSTAAMLQFFTIFKRFPCVILCECTLLPSPYASSHMVQTHTHTHKHNILFTRKQGKATVLFAKSGTGFAKYLKNEVHEKLPALSHRIWLLLN